MHSKPRDTVYRDTRQTVMMFLLLHVCIYACQGGWGKGQRFESLEKGENGAAR